MLQTLYFNVFTNSDEYLTKHWLSAKELVAIIPNPLNPKVLEYICNIFQIYFVRCTECQAIILMGKRELVALLNLSSWCLVKVELLFLAVPRGCLRFVIVIFPDHTHLRFLSYSLFN